jgi:hypothetical protein
MAAMVRIAAAVAVALSIAGCASEEIEDEPIGESGSRLLEGRRLSESETARHLRSAGFPEDAIGPMVCAAKYESSFYERAFNRNDNGSVDRGLFQINSIHVGGTRGCPSRGDDLWDAATNARCAYAIYRMQGMNAWYGYRAHRRECQGYGVREGGGAASDGDADADSAGAGGCWSRTLNDMVEPLACVTSSSTGLRYQCNDGEWYRGVSGNDGPFGACRDTKAPALTGDTCLSQTLNREMPEGSCVQSKFDSIWFQCNDGQWFRGVSGDDGPFGPCVSMHPL